MASTLLGLDDGWTAFARQALLTGDSIEVEFSHLKNPTGFREFLDKVEELLKNIISSTLAELYRFEYRFDRLSKLMTSIWRYLLSHWVIFSRYYLPHFIA